MQPAAVCPVTLADVPDIGKPTGACNFAIILYETMPSLSRYLEEHNVGITARQLIESASPGIKAVFEQLVLEGGPNAVPKAVYDEAVKVHWPAAQAAYRNYFKENAVVAAVFPTTLLPASPDRVYPAVTRAGSFPIGPVSRILALIFLPAAPRIPI